MDLQALFPYKSVDLPRPSCSHRSGSLPQPRAVADQPRQPASPAGLHRRCSRHRRPVALPSPARPQVGRRQRRRRRAPAIRPATARASRVVEAEEFEFAGIGDAIQIQVPALRRRRRADSVRPACRSDCGSRRVTPSARSNARASVDLPAPRSPCRCTTARAGRVRASAAPSASVASASGRHRSHRQRSATHHGIGEAAQVREQIRRQQPAFAAVARRRIAGSGMQQRAAARRIERGQVLAHATRRSRRSARRPCRRPPCPDCRQRSRAAFRPGAATMRARALQHDHARVAFAQAPAQRRNDRAARRRCRCRAGARLRRDAASGSRRQAVRTDASPAGSTHRHRARSGLPLASARSNSAAPPCAPARGPGPIAIDVGAIAAAGCSASASSTPRTIASGTPRQQRARHALRASRRSTRPAPLRSAASAHSTIAPPLPWSPPMHSTWPDAALVRCCGGAAQASATAPSRVSSRALRAHAVERIAAARPASPATASPT